MPLNGLRKPLIHFKVTIALTEIVLNIFNRLWGT